MKEEILKIIAEVFDPQPHSEEAKVWHERLRADILEKVETRITS